MSARSPRRNAGTALGRTTLWALIAATALVTLISAVYALWFSITAGIDKSNRFSFPVVYAAPMEGDRPSEPAVPGAGSDVRLEFSDILVSAPVEQLREPQVLAAFATAIPFLLVIVGGIGVIALAWRLLGAKPFSGAARGLLIALGALSLLNSVLVPWLEARSAARAVEILNLPSDGTQVPSDQHGWVVAPGFSFLQDAYWPYLALGVVLLLVAALWQRASRLQRETEGLV